MAKLIFPSFLSEPSYKYRCVKIKVIKSTRQTETLDDIVNVVTDTASKVSDAITEEATKADLSAKGILKATASAAERIGKVLEGTTETVFTVVLPLPNEFSDNQTHDWAQTTGVAKGLANKIGLTDSVIEKGIAIAADTMGMRKPLIDPSYFQNYSGSNLRDFNLTFDLIPNSGTEATEILAIINVLKRYSSPSVVASNAMIQAPHYFDIDFGNPYLDTIIGIKGVVIKDISITYGASGQMAYVGADGMIKHTKLSLTFGERRMKTANEWGM